MKRFGWLIPLVVACIFGVINSFRPTLSSAFERMQANPIDTRFNHYILEHSYRCVTDRSYAGTFWSPRFFCPADHVLAYSDNLVGSAPVYWLFRTILAPSTAFSLWMIGCGMLCFASFAALGRRLNLHPVLIAAGAFIFAFGIHRARLINHQQMLPQFFLPLAVWAAWEWSEKPTVKKLIALLACVYLQQLCGMYLGWFAALSLLIFGAILLLDTGRRRTMRDFLRQRWGATIVAFVVFMAISAVTFWPYVVQQRITGGYRWDEVKPFVPTIRLLLPPWNEDSAAAGTTFSVGVKPALPLGGLVFAAGILVVGAGLRFADQRRAIHMTALITGILLLLLSARWGDQFTLWRAIYAIVPGAKGIRAVSRIDVTIMFYLTLALMIGLNLLLQNRHFLATVVAIVLCCEQWVTGLPSFEVRPWESDVQQLSDLMKSGGDASYVEYFTPRNYLDFTAMEISAMWAGLEANKPIVNGYSGRLPPGYDARELMKPPVMLKRLSSATPPPATFTVITPKQPGFPREWGEQLPQESIWTTDNFVGVTFRLK